MRRLFEVVGMEVTCGRREVKKRRQVTDSRPIAAVKAEMLNVNVRFPVTGNCFRVYADRLSFCTCYNIIRGATRGKKEGGG